MNKTSIETQIKNQKIMYLPTILFFLYTTNLISYQIQTKVQVEHV